MLRYSTLCKETTQFSTDNDMQIIYIFNIFHIMKTSKTVQAEIVSHKLKIFNYWLLNKILRGMQNY